MLAKKTTRANRVFSRGLFKRLFFSYAAIIMSFFVIYVLVYLNSVSTSHREQVNATYTQSIFALNAGMEVQLLTAQNLAASVNGSEAVKAVHDRVFIERGIVDPVLLYKIRTEMKNIKTSWNNLNIYNILLSFKGDEKTYTAGELITFKGEAKLLEGNAYLGLTKVSDLWGIDNKTNMMLNKRYLVYGEPYTATRNGSVKGTILVLFDESKLLALLESFCPQGGGVVLECDGETLLACGIDEGERFRASSSINSRISLSMFVSHAAYSPPLTLPVLFPLFIGLVASVLFIFVTYMISKRHYAPYSRIQNMIGVQSQSTAATEVDSMLEGIRNIVGERNGYREKMVTITPYAHQGVLHGLLQGNMQKSQLKVLTDEQFIDMKMPYFLIALVNIAYQGDEEIDAIRYQDITDIMQQACHQHSTDDMLFASYMRDVQNVYIILNTMKEGDCAAEFHAFMTYVKDEIDDGTFVLTMGVGSPQSDITQIKAACKEASRALDQMITGGRGAVYFYDPELSLDIGSYEFPKDAARKLARDLKSGNETEAITLLDRLYERNVVQQDLSPRTLQRMVDELHASICAALQLLMDTNTTQLHVDRIEGVATIDEIWAYYKAVFQTLCEQCMTLEKDDPEERKLENEIMSYIDAHALDSDISLQGVADFFGVSTKYICMLFKNRYEKTYLQYVHEKQIVHAMELLRSTRDSLEIISAKCGFTNVLTFRRNFKAVTGMNPSDYRQ